MQKPEILAPAGSMEALLAALRCGADAVYAGGKAYSARSSAANFDLPQLKEAAEICHIYGAKLYLAVNTLLTDSEWDGFLCYIRQAVQCGVDGCIVQDIGVLQCMRSMFPELPLHASTQMSIHTPEGAMQAAELGCSRVVAAREMSCADLQKLCRLPLEIECFVHGALCMSVSGQCSFSALVGNRSANRGRCAQACRLPWRTPSGSNPAALSLKDLSLVNHVQALREAGVASFKIEGRMKRPEYVAAAVAALRTALDGGQPDMDTLQAIFSRSGFTDGYFTGKKQDMFGFRRKEDAAAARNVMKALQDTCRKPRKISRIRFDVSLREGEPVYLTASDTEGNIVSVCGEIPQKALQTPLQLPLLQKQLHKLGDTVFEGGGVTLDNPCGLTISASACNAMRREAVEKLYQCRKEQSIHTRVREVRPLSKGRDTEKQPVLRWHIRTPEQLGKAADMGDIVCAPIKLAENFPPSDTVWLEAPRIIANEDKYCRTLARLHEKGYSHLLCHNLADIRIGKRFGFVLHGGFGLNCTNRRTAESLKSQGLCDVTGSYEMRMSSLISLGQSLPCGAFVYGRMPMMLFRLCPIHAQDGCRRSGCCMQDRTGQKFPLLCSGDYMELCNAKRLWIADKPRLLQFLSYWDLYLAEEMPEEMPQLAQAYRNGRGNAPDDRTNGLYWKGGLT